MTDIELPDFTTVSPTSPVSAGNVPAGSNGHHLSIDLEKGVFNQIRTKTKSGSISGKPRS